MSVTNQLDTAPAVDSAAAPVLALSSVAKRAGRHTVLESVDLEVRPGEVVGLVGRNGAGKSTLMRIATGLATASGGHVERASVVALLPEKPAFVEHASGRRNLALLGALRAHPTPAEITTLLQQVGLGHAGERPVRKYSQGMRQRLGVAQALMERAALVVLDEPANGLDPDGMRWLRQVIRAEAARGAGVLVSSHLLDELERSCGRVVLLDGGRIRRQWVSGERRDSSLLLRSTDPHLLHATCARQGWPGEVAADGGIALVTQVPTPEVVKALVVAGVPLLEVREVHENLESLLAGGTP